MENRSVIKLLVLSVVTLGIYSLFWQVWTARELRAKGQDVPTTWLLIVPIANLYYLYKYYGAAEAVTGGAVNQVLYFALAFFISPALSAVLAQNEYNKVGESGPMPGVAPAATNQAMPAAAATPGVVQQPAAPAPQPQITTPEAPQPADTPVAQPPEQPPQA